MRRDQGAVLRRRAAGWPLLVPCLVRGVAGAVTVVTGTGPGRYKWAPVLRVMGEGFGTWVRQR